MIVRSQDTYSDSLRFSTWLSVIAHALVIWFFTHHLSLLKLEKADPGIVVDVSYLPPAKEIIPRIERPRIVSPSDSPETTPPENARLLSERNSRVEREQLKRGDMPDAGPAALSSTTPQKAPAQPQKSSPPKEASRSSQRESTAPPRGVPKNPAPRPRELASLKLDPKTLQDKFGELPAARTSDETLKELMASGTIGDEPQNMGALVPFSRSPGSGARFLGLQGNPDYLPYLPDGDLTLLNAKANLFAVFVRRVALQVFSQLRNSGWEYLRATDIRAIQTESTVRAVLSLKGELLKVELEQSSGSDRFDQVLLSSVQGGAKDPNPPKEAAAKDGNIHFVFKSKSWVRSMSDPRAPGPFEQRWLMLGTGLD